MVAGRRAFFLKEKKWHSCFQGKTAQADQLHLNPWEGDGEANPKKPYPDIQITRKSVGAFIMGSPKECRT